jgi:putative heme-binding domain-containing protein
VSLVEKFQPAGQGEGLLEALLASPADSTGAGAARLLLDAGDTSRLEAVLAGEDDTAALRAAVALANARDPRSVPLFVPRAASADADEQLGAPAVRGLASTKQGAERLLDLARSNKLASGLRTVAAVSLSSVIWDEIKTAAAAVLPLPPSKDNVPLPPIPALAALAGDREEGLKVFEAQCQNCHVAGGRGKDFGPALTEIGDKLGKDALFLSILDPSAGISFNYEGEVVSLTSGTDLVGIVMSETPDTITLKLEGAIVATYPKGEVASRVRLKTSIMPSDLQKNMTRADLVNLVEFLSGLKKGAGK